MKKYFNKINVIEADVHLLSYSDIVPLEVFSNPGTPS